MAEDQMYRLSDVHDRSHVMLCFLRDVDDELPSEPTLRILRLLAENKTMIGLAALREIVGLLNGNERLVESLDNFLCDDLEFVVGKKTGPQVQLTSGEDVVVGLWRDKPATRNCKREVSTDNPETRQSPSANGHDEAYSSSQNYDEAASQQFEYDGEEDARLAYATNEEETDEERLSGSQDVAEADKEDNWETHVVVKQEEDHAAVDAGTQRLLAPDCDGQPQHHGPTLHESYNQDDQQAASCMTHEASEDETMEAHSVVRQNEAYEPASAQDADEQALTKCDLQDEALSLEALVSENDEDHGYPPEETVLGHARGQVSSSRHSTSIASDGEHDENLSGQATPFQDAGLDCDRSAVVAGEESQRPPGGDAANRDKTSEEDEDVRLQADSICKPQAIDGLQSPGSTGMECERRAARERLYHTPKDEASDAVAWQGPGNETQTNDPKKRMHGLVNQRVLKRIKHECASTPTSSEEIPPADDEQEQERGTTNQQFKDNGEEDTSRAYATVERQVGEEHRLTPTTGRGSLVDQRVLKRLKRETPSTPTNGEEIQQEQVQQHETTNQRYKDNGEEDTRQADSTIERPVKEEQRSFATGRKRDVTEHDTGIEGQAQAIRDAISIGASRQEKPKNEMQLQHQDVRPRQATYQDAQQEAGDKSHEAPDDETIEVGDAGQSEPEDADECLVDTIEIVENAIQRLLANHPSARWMAMKSNLLAEKTDYHNILHLRTRSTWEVGTVILATKKISPDIFLNLHPDAGGPGRHYVIGVVVMIGDVDKLINGRDAVDICKKDVVHRKIVVAFCRGGTMKSLERDNCKALRRACRTHGGGVRISEMWERAAQVLEYSERKETDLL